MSVKRTFEAWKDIVETVLIAKYSVSSEDIPDWRYLHAYNSGATPKNAATAAWTAGRLFTWQ